MLSCAVNFTKYLLQPTTVFAAAITEQKLLVDHTSYHRCISGQEAGYRLKSSGHSHCYLTRFSKSQESYVLSVYQYQKPKHVVENFQVIVLDGGRCRVSEKEHVAGNIDELLTYYERNPISPSFTSIGQKYTREMYENKRSCIIL